MNINNIKINIPEDVKSILCRLSENEYEAYIVGGAVRDSILGKKPKDWDICTSALPEEIKAVFGYTIDTGIKHGTVTVMYNEVGYEVTTFRIDGEYTDSRRPDSVEFTKDITKDLSRRDFTINAMAMDVYGKLYDPFGGVYDIEHKIIRCVGDPKERFEEDKLRILRAIRFASTLGFEIDELTDDFIFGMKWDLSNISKERIKMEWDKILISKDVSRWIYYMASSWDGHLLRFVDSDIMVSYDFEQFNPYHIYDVFEHIAHAVGIIEPDLILRLAMFYHDIGKPMSFEKVDGRGRFYEHNKHSAEICEKSMKNLRYDTKSIELVRKLVYFHDYRTEVKRSAVKRFLNKLGSENFEYWYKMRIADILSQNLLYAKERLEKAFEIKKLAESIIELEEAFSINDIDINGREIMDIMEISEGSSVGEWKMVILYEIIEDNIINEKSAIIEFLERRKKYIM